MGCCNPCQPCCAQPFAQVLITVPPPIAAPTRPQPVCPLKIPSCSPCKKRPLTDDEACASRYSNFYNNYNVDWRACDPGCDHPAKGCCSAPPNAVTVGGQDPCCPRDKCKPKRDYCNTGFKTCTMRMFGPPPCNPCGPWCAQIQKCSPKKRKKVSSYYCPGPCTRPCCLHWTPKEGPCLYDLPCKAHCYNHPPGIKPGRRLGLVVC